MGGDSPANPPTNGVRGDPPWASARGNLAPPIAAPPRKATEVAVKPRRAPRKRSRLGRLLVALLLVIGLWSLYEYMTLPDAREVVDTNPQTTALMRAREQAALSEGKKPRRRQYWVPLESVEPRAVDAVIISEDGSFYRHRGIDFDELSKVLGQAWDKGSIGRGASTITQQLAKNLWLSADRSFLRKAKELILARRLEDALPKKRILTLYLNVVEWGDGVYGIEAASREHFGVSASQLSVGKGAILAAMLPSPRRWTPERRSPALRKRALWIVDRLQEYGKVSAENAQLARSEIEQLLSKAPGTSEPAEERDQPSEDDR